VANRGIGADFEPMAGDGAAAEGSGVQREDRGIRWVPRKKMKRLTSEEGMKRNNNNHLKPPKPMEFVKPYGSTFTVASVPGFLGLGLTGIVLRHGNNALKIPRVQVTTDLSAKARYYAEYNNEMNIEQMENEKQVYERLGNHIRVVSCFRISADGIEMTYIKNGSLNQYFKNYQQGADNLKAAWLRSLVDTLCYIHERGVLINNIALRNILLSEDLLLNFVNFSHSSLY
jgi:serine/threonine protein kinase